MKPSWEGAPLRANWLAMDANGLWYWLQDKPIITGVSWLSETGRIAPADDAPPLNPRWTESLEKRP